MSALTQDEVRGYAAGAGFAGSDLDIAAAVAMAESGGNPGATGDIDNPVAGASSRGLWQINTHYWPQFDPAQLYDPAYNATAARVVQQAQGWSAWSTYNNGAYKQYMASTFIYPGFASLSEFVPRLPSGAPKRNGDCGPDAVLMALHCVDPVRWPLTAGALDALCNDMAAKGCLMAANGMSNIPGLDSYLTKIGVPHTTVGYAQFTLDGLHTALKNLALAALRQLVIVEWSAAGAGLHDDEPGVQYHYSTFGGIAYGDPNTANDGYYRGDGDSNTDNPNGAQTSAILTGWPAIAAAAPIGYITIPVPTKEQATVSIVLEHDSAGNVSGAHNQDNPAVHVGPGFASSISSGNLLAAEILIGETYAHTPSGNIGYCVVSGPGTPTAGRYVGTWLPNDLHFDDRAEVAQVLVAVKHDADTSAAQVGQLQQQLKAAQAQDATDAAAATAAEAADATDKAAATKAQADLATAEQTITQLEAQLAAQQGNSGEGAALIAELKKALGLS